MRKSGVASDPSRTKLRVLLPVTVPSRVAKPADTAYTSISRKLLFRTRRPIALEGATSPAASPLRAQLAAPTPKAVIAAQEKTPIASRFHNIHRLHKSPGSVEMMATCAIPMDQRAH